MSFKIFGSSLSSACKPVISKVTKTVSKISGGSSSSKSSNSGNKFSSSSSRPTSSSSSKNISKISTTQKYVTNASALYSSSGKKVTTISTSSYSTGRPSQSYIPQQKASATKAKTSAKATPAKPVATQAPVITKKKKDSSEASFSNNRPQQSYTHVKNYTPTASRAGAGVMIYSSKTNPKGAKAAASYGASLLPYVGDAKDVQEALSGRDLITGKRDFAEIWS